MSWWVRPFVRLMAAISLPFVVPLAIAIIIWTMPGDPVTNLCPSCSEATLESLTKDWHMESVWSFYQAWLGNAVFADFGDSYAFDAGTPVASLLWGSLPNTALVVLIALIPILAGSVFVAFGRMSAKMDPVWQALGAPPAVILALFAIAGITIAYGAQTENLWLMKIVPAGLILGIADGVLAGSIVGTRSTFESEMKQRYVGIAILRGESVLSNTLANVLPSLVSQFRARLLHILSGTVVVEVVLQVNGIGDMLFKATLKQDFLVVLAAAWGFAVISGCLLLIQALVEIGVARHIRRSPKVAA